MLMTALAMIMGSCLSVGLGEGGNCMRLWAGPVSADRDGHLRNLLYVRRFRLLHLSKSQPQKRRADAAMLETTSAKSFHNQPRLIHLRRGTLRINPCAAMNGRPQSFCCCLGVLWLGIFRDAAPNGSADVTTDLFPTVTVVHPTPSKPGGRLIFAEFMPGSRHQLRRAMGTQAQACRPGLGWNLAVVGGLETPELDRN